MKYTIAEKLELELIRALDTLITIVDSESLTLDEVKNEARKTLEGIKKFDQYEKFEDL